MGGPVTGAAGGATMRRVIVSHASAAAQMAARWTRRGDTRATRARRCGCVGGTKGAAAGAGAIPEIAFIAAGGAIAGRSREHGRLAGRAALPTVHDVGVAHAGVVAQVIFGITKSSA